MHWVVWKFVPRLLTEDQRGSCVAICQKLSNRASEDETFLKQFITGDKTWVNGHDLETKMLSSQWIGKISPRPKNGRRVRSNVKVTLTDFFWHRGCYASWILTSGENSDHWYYLEVLKHLRENIRRKNHSCGETTPGSSIMTTHQLMHHYDSWLFGQHENNGASPATLLTWPGSGTLSYFPNWNPLWKDDHFRRFKRLRKIRRRSYARSLKRRTSTVTRSGNGVGSGASMQEGSTLKTIRLTQLQACPKKFKI
jgi:hypothetical protein